jgi:hypothetical protein
MKNFFKTYWYSLVLKSFWQIRGRSYDKPILCKSKYLLIHLLCRILQLIRKVRINFFPFIVVQIANLDYKISKLKKFYMVIFI